MGTKNGKKRKSNNNNNNNIERAAAAADRLHSKKRKKEKAIDRLSNLPNDLIHKILSFISIKDSVKTSALSSRYRFIWTTMPYLNFSTEDFPKLPKFSKFVTHFLTRRNSRIDVYSLNLCFRGKLTQPSVKKLMDYAFSHNIQRLDVECLLEEDKMEFPLSMFSSGRSLKHLSLKQGLKTLRSDRVPKRTSWRSVYKHGIWTSNLKVTSNLELPALTTLYLESVLFCSDDNCVGLLSKCVNLKNLTLDGFHTVGMSSFNICHPGLSNLTLDTAGLHNVEVNVVAPQLENLTIRCEDRNSEPELVVSAPNLASLAYRGYRPLDLSTSDGFGCLKKADIWVIYPNVDYAHQMVSLLQQLHNVKFLTLNLEIIKLLSSSVEVISHQPSPFVNLMSLTVYPEKIDLPKGKVHLSTEVKNYLLDSSPGATFTMFSREEIKAMKDAASAQKLMAELRVLLEEEKANTKTKGKATMESSNAKMQVQIGENIPLIKSCWKDLSEQLKQRKYKACRIISMLENIEEVLKMLPETNRAMIQPCFSSLCAEMDTVMSKITDCMKMECDENQSRLSVLFHELATSTTMESSS